MKAFLLAGSSRVGSHTRATLNDIAHRLEAEGVETKIWDLAETPLTTFEVPYHKDQSLIEDGPTQAFLAELNSSDMVVLGTPLYHGSYSGTLKSALDFLLKDQLFRKPVGLVCNGDIKAAVALSHLVAIVQTLYGVPMQTQILTNGDDFSESDTGFTLTSSEIQERNIRLAKELVHFAQTLKR